LVTYCKQEFGEIKLFIQLLDPKVFLVRLLQTRTTHIGLKRMPIIYPLNILVQLLC